VVRKLAQRFALFVAPIVIAVASLIAFPQVLFAHQVTEGRLTLYSDAPFDPGKGKEVLQDIEARLESSPLDDHKPHGVFITNTDWRRRIAFLAAEGAAGVNLYPITNNVFIARADIDHDTVYGASGKAAAAPRTLAYYAAHEITHSFTAEYLGPWRLWNRGLPQWIREGYADYVGMRGHSDFDDLYRRYLAGDPDLDFERSHTYARFRMLVAFMIERRGWSVADLLASKLSLTQAEAMLNAEMPKRRQ
jgi:hypothetical protein